MAPAGKVFGFVLKVWEFFWLWGWACLGLASYLEVILLVAFVIRLKSFGVVSSLVFLVGGIDGRFWIKVRKKFFVAVKLGFSILSSRFIIN